MATRPPSSASEQGPQRPGHAYPIDPWLETIEWLMERSIPIGRWRVGLDPILGLIPGAGDYLGAVIQLIVIGRAAQLGVPRSALARMLVNSLLDTTIGAIPVAGDLFDFGFKANSRNLRIIREAAAGRRRPARDWGFVLVVLLLFAAALAVPIALVVAVFGWL